MTDTASNLPPPVKHFQRYTSEQRADLMASHRLTKNQRTSVGEVFWTSDAAPGIAFPTRKAALRASRT